MFIAVAGPSLAQPVRQLYAMAMPAETGGLGPENALLQCKKAIVRTICGAVSPPKHGDQVSRSDTARNCRDTSPIVRLRSMAILRSAA